MNHRTFTMVCSTALTLCATAPVSAHHAREFLKVGSVETMEQGKVFGYVSWEYAFSDVENKDSFNNELTPGFIIGWLDGFQTDTHFHALDVAEDESSRGLFIESFALDGKVRLPEHLGLPVEVAANLEFEQPTFTGRSVGGTDPRLIPRLIVGKELPFRLKAVLNLDWLIDVHGGDRDDQWGFAGAVKYTATDWLAIGLEWFNPSDAHGFSILPGVYLGQEHGWQGKVGLQIGLTEHADDLAILTTFGYQF